MRGDSLRRRGVELTSLPRWRLVSPPARNTAREIAAALSLPEPLAALLVQRGFADPASVRAFLRPDLDTLSDPYLLRDMAAAVEVIVAAAKRNERVLVHGDYDVDGISATSLLVRALRIGGVDVHGFVPHRGRDGYDFGDAGLAEAARLGASLIITCDCGITAVDAVAKAKAAGLRVVVTDHHLPGPVLPGADAVIDPQRPDDTSGLGMLAGTGVAFKLVQALVEPLGLPSALPMHLLDIVALATVADVVPLTGENRVMVKHGLRLLAESRWPGLAALVEEAGIRAAPGELRAGQVGYVIAPRLNAVGRIGEPMDGLRLLLTDDPSEAAALARHLGELNRQRQALDQSILDEALRRVDRLYHDPESHRALVIDGEDWHAGVVGIVASRVVERFGRPAFLISTSGGTGKGSGRSIDRFDLHAALSRCGDLLIRFGGHRMAAGLTIDAAMIPAFRERFSGIAAEQLAVSDLGPEQRVDLELTSADITDDLERLGRHLEPCGMGNPAPVYGIRGVRLSDTRVIGSGHLRGRIGAGDRMVDAIAFGWADRAADILGGEMDLAFRLERNEWQGRSTLQARLMSLSPSAGMP